MTFAEGQFISEYQLSYKNLGNRDYIFQRTSDGLVTDAKFFDMLPEVKTVENRGAVHNFRPNKSWEQQAEKFLTLSSGKGFKVLCGDFESGELNKQAAIDFWCFLRRLEEQKPNKKVIFYTTIYKLRDNLNKYNGVETLYGPIDWEHFDCWIAQYPISTNPDGTTNLHVDPQTASPYLSISGVVVREKPQKFWQYWADGNQQGSKYGCGSRDTNLDIFNGTVVECKEFFTVNEEPVDPPDPGDPPDDDCCEEIAFQIKTNSTDINAAFNEIYKLEKRIKILEDSYLPWWKRLFRATN